MQENMKVRIKAKNNGVQIWKIAAKLGISEPTITRWLRVPLSADREELIINAIRDIVAEREAVI